MSRVCRILCLSLIAAGASWAQQPGSRSMRDRMSELMKSKLSAPQVASPLTQVDRMLDAAALKSGETLYDLGCGDGRILIAAVQKYHAKAVGVELLPTKVSEARDSIQRNGLQDMASVIEGDARDVDLTKADVITLYMSTDFNDELKPRLEKSLHAGARVVSFEYPIPGWKPQRTERADMYNRKHLIYVYQMPPVKK